MESLKIVPKNMRKTIRDGHYPGVFATWLVYGLRARKALRWNQKSLNLEQRAALAEYSVSNLRKSVAFLPVSCSGLSMSFVPERLQSKPYSPISISGLRRL